MHPKFQVSLSFIDWALEIIGGLLVIAAWYILLTNYGQLPGQVPVHYDFWGNPDGYSGKELLWLVPVMMTAVYFGLSLLHLIPHYLNYPVSVTETNAQRLYIINLRTLRVIRVLIAGQLFYGEIGLIGIVDGELSKLSTYHLPLFLGALALTLIISYWQMFRLKNA